MKIAILRNAASALAVLAFDPGKAGWKLDKDGKIEMKDGNPIFVDADGKEMTVEHGTISRLNGENKTHREAKEAAEAKLKAFEKITDPEAAIKAIEAMAKIDQKKLIDAGEVDKVKDEISKAFTKDLAERDEANGKLQSQLNSLRLDRAFDRSKFIQDRVALPPEMFRDSFGKHFKMEDGNIVPYDKDGNKIYSSKRHGEIADMDEALEKLVELSPYKEQILKAPNASGSGNNGSGGNRGGSNVMSRADFEKLSPADQSALALKGETRIVSN